MGKIGIRGRIQFFFRSETSHGAIVTMVKMIMIMMWKLIIIIIMMMIIMIIIMIMITIIVMMMMNIEKQRKNR